MRARPGKGLPHHWRNQKPQAATGTLLGVENMEIVIRAGEKSRKKGLVGRGDGFYIEGAEPGVYSGQAGECIFRLEVPDDAGAIHDAGIVQCHPSQ